MSGPVGIVKVIGDTYEQSKDSGVLAVVMNLLPLPALDGGRLVLFIVEAIRGKKLNEKIEGKIHFVGLVLLMGLMVFIMYNDIVKIFFS